jgi:hypothetical protein
MAENPVAEVAKTAEKAVTQPFTWARQSPWAFAFLIVVAGFIFMRLSGKIAVYLQNKTATGSKFWIRVAKMAGVTAAVLIGLYAADALALGEMLKALPLMAVAFPMADFVALKDEAGNFKSKLTPDATLQERKFNFLAPRETYAGFPIRVKSVNFSLKARLTQAASTADTIPWDALHVLCAGLDVRSPRFDMLARKEDLPGAVLKHIDEVICRGYEYSGDEIFADISATAAGYTRTLYYAYCFEQRWAAKPEEYEMFAGWLQGTQFSFWLNKATILSDLGFSTGNTIAGTDVELTAGFRYGVGAVQGDVRGAYTVPPLVNRRIIKKPAQGQEDIPFEGIGGTGPANTSVGAGERIVAMMLLSDNLGLPGAGPVNDILEFGCEAVGLMNTQNVDMYLAGKLPRMPRENQFGIVEGAATRTLSQRWPWTLSHEIGTGNLLEKDDLLAMPILLPSMGTKVTKLPRLKGDISVHARRNTPPSTGMHGLYVLSLRDIDPAYGAQMLASAGVSGQTTRSVSHDADTAVNSGRTNPASYVGIPQVVKGAK